MQKRMPKYQKRLIELAAEKDLCLTPLGIVEKWPIWLVRTTFAPKSKKKRVLISAGFHGEEQAGPYAILEWLEKYDKDNYKGVDVSFLPVVNPSGFNVRRRYNTKGEVNNCGFCHEDLHGAQRSEEGDVLYQYRDRLYSLGMNGFLSLHEDDTIKKEYYLYTFEPTPDPGQFTCQMLEVLHSWFDTPLNGAAVADTNLVKAPFIVNGLVYKYCDGSFDDYMFHRGVQRVAVTETPAKASLSYRVDANVDVIDKFINLIIRGI